MHNEKTGRAKQEPEMITGDEFPQERVVATEPEPSPAQAELDQLKGERDQLLDRLARLQAEFDNARKREPANAPTPATTPSRTPSSPFSASWTTSSWL